MGIAPQLEGDGGGQSPNQSPINLKTAPVKLVLRRGKILGVKRPKFGEEGTFLENLGKKFS